MRIRSGSEGRDPSETTEDDLRDPYKCDHEWDVIATGGIEETYEKICIHCGVEFDEDVHTED